VSVAAITDDWETQRRRDDGGARAGRTGVQDLRARVRAFLERTNAGDFSVLDEFIHDDYVEDYPQTGERIEGRENLRAILSNWPGGGLQRDEHRTVDADSRWVVTPTATVVRVEGTGDTITAIQRIAYPDGSSWHVIVVARMRDGKVAHAESYFAPELEAPEWRRAWVTRGVAADTPPEV
jgi:ketosteroid isomerase-like protein